MSMKILGVVPARMGSSRFRGKPLFSIKGRPMLEHVYCRANMYPDWTELVVATCDDEIAQFCTQRDYPVLMTSDRHTRALDRVAEAAGKCSTELTPDDVVVCVQGDEPMMHPDMIDAAVQPLRDDPTADCTMLGMPIRDEEQYRDPNILKIVARLDGTVLYTSRSPIPHCKEFTTGLGAQRIYGIFAFRWHYLQTFTSLPESPLELAEACDSNRIMDNGDRQKIAPFPWRPSFSVDTPADAAKVERHMEEDELWGRY